MDYKNFIKRSIISLLLVVTYIFLLNYFTIYLFYLICILYFIFFLEIYLNFKKLKIYYYLYIGVSLYFFINLQFLNLNFILFNLMILIVIIFDIFSYILGKLFGKNKIFKISPNKTYEGLIGGIIVSNIFAYIYTIYYSINFNYLTLFFINILILSSFVGDTLESFFKRKNNLKNSSNFIPGHGGFLDRFDSLIFSIIVFNFVKSIL